MPIVRESVGQQAQRIAVMRWPVTPVDSML